MTGRVLVFGDIHGCDRAFATMLDHLAVNSTDTVVLLGDVVDRGPDSRGVIEKILDVQKACSLVFVLGNHEEMLLDALEGHPSQRWLRSGGAATVESYGGTLANFPETHYELLHNALSYWENPTNICIHANLEPGVELSEQQPEWLRWQRLTGMEYPHPSGKLVVCGHSGISGGLPVMSDGWVCLDTLAYQGSFLTCLDAKSGALFQSQQSGGFRCGICLSDLR